MEDLRTTSNGRANLNAHDGNGDAVTPDGLTVSFEPGRDGLLVRCVGEVDMSSAIVLAQALEETSERRASSVLVDLSEVSFIDAAGMRALLRGTGHLSDAGVAWRVRLSRQVRRVADILGIRGALEG